MNAIPSSINKSLSLARKENKNAFIVVVSFHLFFFFFVVVVGNSAQHSVSEPVPAHRCRARRPRPKTRSKRPFSLSPRPAPPPSGPTGAFPFPPPFFPPAPAPTAPRIPAHVREDRPPRFPPRARIAPPSPEPSQREETVPRSGAAYRGATPRGARGSTTRCRGRQRRGTPGSRPAAPQSCGAKRTPLVSTARPRHASVPPPAAPSAGPLPALKESSHPVTIIRFQSERVCRGRAQHSAAPAACSALLRAPVACTSGEGNTKLFPSEILQTSSTKMYCNSRKSVHAIMNSVFLLNPSAQSPNQIIVIMALQFCWEDLSGPSQPLKKTIFQRDRCPVCRNRAWPRASSMSGKQNPTPVPKAGDPEVWECPVVQARLCQQATPQHQPRQLSQQSQSHPKSGAPEVECK